MTFSKHNWNQLSQSSQNELKRLQEEAFNSGRKSVLNEQSGLGGWGGWMDYWLWGYAGRIRSRINDDGTVTYEFDPPHPHYGGSWTGPLGTRLYDLLNPVNFGDKPGSYDPPKPGKDDKQPPVDYMAGGLQGRASKALGRGGMPTSGMGMGMREAWKAGFDAGRESLYEQMGMNMRATKGMGSVDKAGGPVSSPDGKRPGGQQVSKGDLNLDPPPGANPDGYGGWFWDEHGYYYRETVWDFGPPLRVTVRYYWGGQWHDTRPDGTTGPVIG
mgnify:CR=1 FL=1